MSESTLRAIALQAASTLSRPNHHISVLLANAQTLYTYLQQGEISPVNVIED